MLCQCSIKLCSKFWSPYTAYGKNYCKKFSAGQDLEKVEINVGEKWRGGSYITLWEKSGEVVPI